MIRTTATACLIALTVVCRADVSTFISVSPEPENYAWWLRAEYNPFSISVRGIPVKKLSTEWCFANEFTNDLFPVEYLKEISPTLSFAVEGRLGQKTQLTALVGAYETCVQEKGLFLLIIEPQKDTNVVRFFEQFAFQKSLAALRLTNKDTLELWWCSNCGNSQELRWDAAQSKFIWLAEDGFSDEETL